MPAAFPDRVFSEVRSSRGTAPLAITIPRLGVESASVVPVGLEPNGELEVPAASAVGWYRHGVGLAAGEGSAVLAGHIAYNGRNGVFRDLVALQTGDTFTVDTSTGESLTYEVSETATYEKNSLPIDELFAVDGEERIVLITCGGDFNPELRSYDDNTVVIANRVA